MTIEIIWNLSFVSKEASNVPRVLMCVPSNSLSLKCIFFHLGWPDCSLKISEYQGKVTFHIGLHLKYNAIYFNFLFGIFFFFCISKTSFGTSSTECVLFLNLLATSVNLSKGRAFVSCHFMPHVAIFADVKFFLFIRRIYFKYMSIFLSCVKWVYKLQLMQKFNTDI